MVAIIYPCSMSAVTSQLSRSRRIAVVLHARVNELGCRNTKISHTVRNPRKASKSHVRGGAPTTRRETQRSKPKTYRIPWKVYVHQRCHKTRSEQERIKVERAKAKNKIGTNMTLTETPEGVGGRAEETRTDPIEDMKRDAAASYTAPVVYYYYSSSRFSSKLLKNDIKIISQGDSLLLSRRTSQLPLENALQAEAERRPRSRSMVMRDARHGRQPPSRHHPRHLHVPLG